MVSVKVVLGNHLYNINNQLYRQLKGGPIGENITNILAEIVMFEFINGYKNCLFKLEIYQYILFIKVYVDDMNQGCQSLPYGTKFINGKLYIPGVGWTGRAWNGHSLTKQEKTEIEETVDREANSQYTGSDREKDSARVFREIANTILPSSIRMVEDTPHHHPSQYLPILDTEMRVSNGKFEFRHFSKPMASTVIVYSKSALSLDSKINILVN